MLYFALSVTSRTIIVWCVLVYDHMPALYAIPLLNSQAVSRHFKTIRVSEKKIVPLFISMVKSHKSKLDQPKPPDS